MKEFLRPTKYCDTAHPDVIAKASELTRSDARETAIATWCFVSHIPYRFDYWSTKASETLDKGYGMCTNKANLQIALLRATGIPAGYGQMKIRKEALRDVSDEEFYAKIAPVTTHIFCWVYLDGRWIASDATRDRFLEGDVPDDPTDNRAYPWNGNTNYKKPPRFVVSEEVVAANIDEKLSIRPRFLNDDVLARINAHIDELAKGGNDAY